MSKIQAQLRIDTVSVDEAGNALANMLNNWLTQSGPVTLFKSCANCKHMREEGPAFCNLWNVTPPVEVIVKACPSHEDNEEIPF